MFISIGKKAEELGVAVVTLRRWHKKGLLVPDEITLGGQRRYKKRIDSSGKQNYSCLCPCIFS